MGQAQKTKIRICKSEDCLSAQTSGGYCRLHYLQNWKQLKEERQKKAAKRLNKYIDRMTKKFPKNYVDEIRKDIHGNGMSDMGVPEEPTDLQRLFADAEYRDEVSAALQDLKIEKDF